MRVERVWDLESDRSGWEFKFCLSKLCVPFQIIVILCDSIFSL